MTQESKIRRMLKRKHLITALDFQAKPQPLTKFQYQYNVAYYKCRVNDTSVRSLQSRYRLLFERESDDKATEPGPENKMRRL